MIFSSFNFNALIPEFYVADFQKSLDFYTQVLDFKIEYQRHNPEFAFLSIHDAQLMIQQEEEDEDWHNGKPEYPFGRGINFQITVPDIYLLLDKLKAINYPLKRNLKESRYKIKDEYYDCIEFLVMDPDGYLLRFSQAV
jgi:catechol 2,3-dioxygenase-like lactoylglutathione lyase family enzyme